MRADPVRSRNAHQKTQTDGRNAQRAVRSHSHIGLSEPKRELLTILGHDQSSTLLYGNERLPTISLTLALPDGRSVDLGQAPVTDQQGVAGLTGRVNNHYLRLLGAIFIGGA